MEAQEVYEALKRIADRLEHLEARLSRLESQRLVLEERRVASREGELEGKTYLSLPDGGLIKETRVPFCDVCGKQTEKFNLCKGCGRKLCSSCSMLYKNRVYCPDCLNELLPLTKEEYKVLASLANGLKDLKKIAEISSIRIEEVRACLKSMLDKSLIEEEGFLFFTDFTVLDKGLEALATYRQVYGNEEDVTSFEESLRRVVNEEE